MNLSEFTANYAHLGNDELLCLWADRKTLVPEASMALDSELQRRGLNKQNATEVKKKLDALAAREAKGSLVSHKVLVANYERDMRHFVGWEEPKFYPPYLPKNDIRNIFAYIGHKYRVWKAFREHTGHWPVFSICFHFLSWSAVIGFTLRGLIWVRKREGGWSIVVVIGCVLVLLGARALGARLMRKLDWKRYGRSCHCLRSIGITSHL